MTAASGHSISSTDRAALSPLPWPVPGFSRTGATEIPARADIDPIVTRLGAAAEPQIGPYRQVDTAIDHVNKTFWCHLRPEGAPSFNHALLRDLAHMQRSIMRLFDDNAPDAELPFSYFVVGSRTPGIFNMGGDLAFLADRIRAGDRDALVAYADACVEVVYNNTIALDLPIITIGLIQGDALGGGFEAALSCNLIVAEKSAKLGLPEILFNLFPGMGAYSLLSRKLDPARAERMILSGRIYSAAELYDMGLVDVVAEDGEGDHAVRHYIAQNARRHAAHRALCDVRRRINPLTFAELRDVTELWVDTALQLTEVDLRKMERLAAAQLRRVETRAAITPQAAAG
jgi:DSF synthase